MLELNVSLFRRMRVSEITKEKITVSNLLSRNGQFFLLVPVILTGEGEFDVGAMVESCHSLVVRENSRCLTEEEMLASVNTYFTNDSHLSLRQISEDALVRDLWDIWLRAGKIPNDPQGEPIVRARFERVLAHVLRSNPQFHVTHLKFVLVKWVDDDFRDEPACFDVNGNMIPYPRWSEEKWAEKLAITAEVMAKKGKRGRPKKAA